MNKFIAIGRLTAEPDIRYSDNGNEQLCIARYTLAVDRKFKKDAEHGADFIRCVAYGRRGEWAEKYLTKGKKIAIDGRIQTGSYEDKNGKTVYTTDIIIENQEFVESKGNEMVQHQAQPKPQPNNDDNEFMDVDDSKLPF